MDVKFISSDGSETVVRSFTEFVELVRSGTIAPETMLYIGQENRWTLARDNRDFQTVIALNSRVPPPEVQPRIQDTSPARQASEALAKTDDSFKYIGWATIISAFVVLSTYASQMFGAYRVGQVFGELFGTFLVIALIAYVSTRGKSDGAKNKGYLLVGVALALFAIKQGIGLKAEKEAIVELSAAADNAVKVTKQSFAEIASPSVNGQTNSARQSTNEEVPAVSATPTRASGSRQNAELLREVAQILRNSTERQAALTKQLQSEIAKLNLETLLLPSTLGSRDGIEDAWQRISKYSALIDKSEEAQKSEVQVLERAVTNLNAGEEFLKGFREGRERAESLTKNVYSVEREGIKLFGSILSFMERQVALGTVVNRDGTLLFVNRPDLAKYQTMIASVTALVKREDEATNAMLKNQEDNANKLRKIAAQ